MVCTKVALASWLVARRGKTLGPQVAVSKYDRKHFCILSGVSLRIVAGAQEIRGTRAVAVDEMI